MQNKLTVAILAALMAGCQSTSMSLDSSSEKFDKEKGVTNAAPVQCPVPDKTLEEELKKVTKQLEKQKREKKKLEKKVKQKEEQIQEAEEQLEKELAKPKVPMAPPEKPKAPVIPPPEIPPTKMRPNMAPEKYAHPLQSSGDMQFMLGEDELGNYLYGEGAIGETTYDDFLKYVSFYKEVKGIDLDRVMMHSPGGYMSSGVKIGEYIRQNGWTTDSDKYMQCYSSCAIIYSAGVTKRMQSGAQVGFHRPYYPDTPDTPEIITDMYRTYLPYWNYVNGDPRLYNAFMKNYGRDEMLIIMAETADKFMNVEIY